MRLLQLLALAAFALLTFKLIALAASGAFEGIGVRDAAAQTTDGSANGGAGNGQPADPAAPALEAPAAAAAAGTQGGAGPQTADDSTKDADVARGFTADNRQIGIPGDSRAALFSQLSERREEIEKRERDLKLREELLQAAEKRLQSQIAKIEEFESTGGGAKNAKESAKDLVTIYETMKPKDAARIFNSLSIGILYKIATAMNPRKLSAVIAEMDVKAAERLTVELAAQTALGGDDQAPRPLTKIGG